jgi:hypothetical protein
MIEVNLNKKFDDCFPIIARSHAIQEIYTRYPKIADKILWSIFLLHYPNPDLNPKINIPYNERLVDIRTSYYDLDIASELVKDAIKSFISHIEPIELKLYTIQRKKLEELTEHFGELDMKVEKDKDEYLAISKILPSIWSNFDKVKKDYLANISKEASTEIEGKGNLSKAEERRLRG